MRGQEYDGRTIKDAVSYLDKYAIIIRGPQDVVALFSKVKVGKRHVVLGLRLLFNFYEALDFRESLLGCLKKYVSKAPKYLRKFAFYKMPEFEVPESIADFGEGRVPKRIGAKQYMALTRQGRKFYPRYVAYLETLRQKQESVTSVKLSSI